MKQGQNKNTIVASHTTPAHCTVSPTEKGYGADKAFEEQKSLAAKKQLV